MGFTDELFVERIAYDVKYRAQFLEAFGVDPSLDKLAEALGAFESSLVAVGSAFDQFEWGNTEAIMEEAIVGARLFRGKAGCSQCHMGWSFTDDLFHDIGLMSTDIGRAGVTSLAEDRFRFRTPTLRNVSRTSPYMHDGSSNTIREVLEHYNSGTHAWRDPSPLLKPLLLSERELASLESFLLTLECDVVSIR